MSNLSIRSLGELLLLFINKRDDFGNKNEELYNPSIKKILTAINEMPHQPFCSWPAGHEHLPRVKKVFLQRTLLCDTGRVFNNKTWVMDRYTFGN